MLWPLYLDRTVVFRKRIRAPLASVSQITSDGEAYLRLQPFIAKIEQDNLNPRLYRILERVPAPFSSQWKISNTFQLTISQPVEDQDGKGVDLSGRFDLSFLVPKLESSVRARETEEAGVVEVIEVMKVQVCVRIDIKSENQTLIVSLEVLSLIALYVMGLVDRAHRVLMGRLAEQVEGEVQG